MSSIFEELMGANRSLTESTEVINRKTKKIKEARKLSVKNIKVESRKIFEETDFDELDQEFAKDVTDENPDEVVLVIDPELPSDEEPAENAAEEMVGDKVYKCPVCGSNYVCDCDPTQNENVEVDEAGVPTECPICGDDADQILVGEIAPAEDAGEKTELDPVDSDDAEKNEEKFDEAEETVPEEEVEEESLKEESLKEEKGRHVKFETDDFIPNTEDGETAESLAKEYNVKITPVGISRLDYPIYEIEGDFDNVVRLFAGAGGDLEWTAKNISDMDGNVVARKEESLKEDFAEEEAVPECDECPECTEEPALDLVVPEEVPAPVVEKEEAPKVEIKDSNVELVLDDSRFESMMTKMVKENYKGDPQFKVTRVVRNKNSGKMRIEYFVREGKKVTKGTLVGEGFNPDTRVSRIKFTDKGAFTESFAKTPSFVVECVRIKNSIKPVSMTYNFKVKVNEQYYRVEGKINK